MKKSIENNNTFMCFVYGTLMRGNSNNQVIGASKFICEAKIKAFACYDSPYGFPLVIPTKDINNEVVGEIWEVPISQLMQLDMLEGYNEGLDDGMYLRRHTVAVRSDNNKECEVSFYLWNRNIPSGSQLVPSGKKWSKKY